jgi:peptidoglycan/xylan/chitin deacetylase (PgdA/CDA1 family)
LEIDRPAFWPQEFTSAMSICFDGGLVEHVELVGPILAEHGIRATFFVTVPAILERPEEWRQIVAEGHELASHSHFGITVDGALPAWTLEMVRDDLRASVEGIRAVAGVEPMSFARDWSASSCADGDYAELLAEAFSGVRLADHGVNDPREVDISRVKSMRWSDLVGPVESLLPEAGQWTVPVFDRFFDLDVEAAEPDLRILLGHLKNREDVWTAPFGEVVSRIKEFQRAVGDASVNLNS